MYNTKTAKPMCYFQIGRIITHVKTCLCARFTLYITLL